MKIKKLGIKAHTVVVKLRFVRWSILI